jgi:spermidine synthase
MGNTHYSVATVLTVFMAGLALGSFLGGRLIDIKGNPLIVYAILEAGIGIYCFLIPHMIDAVLPLLKWIYSNYQNDYATASFFRFLVCGAILLIPTSLMGATLPVLGKLISTDKNLIGKDVGTLYAMNTFGAVFGALASVYVLMRNLGVNGTILVVALINISVAALILILYKRRQSYSTPPTKTPKIETEDSGKSFDREMLFIYFCFGLSGATALIYQVAWNRIFSLLLGSSIYAFSLILTTFIFGLAVGTAVFSKICNIFKDLHKVFGLLQIGIAIFALIAIPFFGMVPMTNRWIYQNWGQTFESIQFANFFIIFTLVFGPTFFMGAQFPIVVKLAARGLPTLGRIVGTVYASNTVGTIIGSFLGGFLLIPWLGIQNTIIFAVMLNMIIGIMMLFSSSTINTNVKYYALPAILILIFLGSQQLPKWDKAVISSGSFMPYRIDDLADAIEGKNKILRYEEGIHTTVTTELAVTGNIFLKVNGKTDASLAQDMRTQLLSGYLPMFMHANPKSALVIGQGSGITLGAVEQFPAEKIDLVEISSAVIEGSRYFSPFNHNALEDPRLSLILEDGRNHVTLIDKKYDVIVSEPSNPWISGVGALFTKNFFELLDQRLNPNGIACIWVHTNMSPESFKSIIKSFISVFPSVTMWESIPGDDYLLIGSQGDYKLPYERLDTLLTDKEEGKGLRRLGLTSVSDIMALMIMDRNGLEKFSAEAPIHTDDNSLLEFAAPEYVYKDERDVIVRQLNPYFKVQTSLLKFETLDDFSRVAVLENMARIERAQSQINEIKKNVRIDQLLDRAQQAFKNGDNGQAIKLYNDILEVDPNHILTYLNLGNTYSSNGQYAQAEFAFKKTLAINPYFIFGSIALAKLHMNQREPEKSANILEDVVAWNSTDAETRFYLGIAYKFSNRPNKSLQELETALKLDKKLYLTHFYLGTHFLKSSRGKAKRHLNEFLKLARDQKDKGPLIQKAEDLLKSL